HTLNDAPTDSNGSYSTEAAFLPIGKLLQHFKLRIQHKCVDAENRTRHRLRLRKPNATNASVSSNGASTQ
ncbi:hypothetical protein AAVH_28510, partial [Aphelenchoides avenae]